MMQDVLYYILPAAISLFWIVRIFLSRDVNRIQLVITGAMLMMVLTFFFGEVYALFIFPLFHIAVRRKTSAEGATKWDWLPLLPSFILIPFQGAVFFRAFLCLQIVALSVWDFVSIRRYNVSLAELFDSSSDMSAEDVAQTLIFVIFTAIIIVIGFSLPEFVISSPWVRGASVVFISILQWMTGSYASRINDTSAASAALAEPKEEDAESEEIEGETCNDDELIRKVVEGKMYLDPTVSLVSLAEKLHTNRTYLSNSIHNCRKQNFSDFINSLRVNNFMELVREEPEINIKEAAMRSGYSNLQSFYRHFSDIMDMTPKAWISKQAG